MSYVSPELLAFKDGPNLDAFGRLRVSHPETLFTSSQEYVPDPLHVENYATGGGSATYTQANSSTVLSTAGTTSGARALRQTKVYWRYQQGKSHLIKMTGTLNKSGTAAGTSVARIGYFDDNNGVFFGRDVTGFFIAKRSNVSGSVVDTKVYQSAWNVDGMNSALNALNPSDITVDFTKEQIFTMDLQWLGVGRVRYYLFINGKLNLVHETMNANLFTAVYIRTANLPCRYEVFNDSGTGANISVEAICIAIESEGGVVDEGGVTLEFDTAGAGRSCANSSPLTYLFSIRLKDTFNGLTYRGHVENIETNILATTNNCYWEWLWNATLGGSPAWSDVNTTYSGVEYDTSATFSGGIAVASGFVVAGGNGVNAFQTSVSAQQPNALILGRTYANVRDTWTLVARGIGGASTVYTATNFEEQY